MDATGAWHAMLTGGRRHYLWVQLCVACVCACRSATGGVLSLGLLQPFAVNRVPFAAGRLRVASAARVADKTVCLCHKQGLRDV